MVGSFGYAPSFVMNGKNETSLSPFIMNRYPRASATP